MTTYHVTVDAPTVWFVVDADDEDEAVTIAEQLAEYTHIQATIDLKNPATHQAIKRILGDPNFSGSSDDLVGFCDGAGDHGPFDFGMVGVEGVED